MTNDRRKGSERRVNTVITFKESIYSPSDGEHEYDCGYWRHLDKSKWFIDRRSGKERRK